MSWLYMLLEITLMVGIDLLFLAALVLLVVPLGMFRQTAFAVLKRNFAGYFSNPTGYVFLCLFVCFTSGFAFWPPAFFASNLANFDQLNKYLPIIMLVYVPAITMSIWSEEKRQGTDELLLTLPTTDIDIVLGKYFAAVFVFTVALLYSQLCNYIVLVTLTNGDLDIGLLATNYLGYWFVGLAMLAIGMIASFVTNNLTVAFVFGVLFNAPLALFSFADTIVGRSTIAMTLREWSLLAMFETFGRGLIGLGPVVYFVAIIVLGLYLCMVLIGRRHWHSGRRDGLMWLHYIVRAWTLLIILIGVVVIIDNSSLRRVRVDLSESRVSTLSSETKAILRDLSERSKENEEGASVITIDAFIADEVPTEYVQTRYELINLLQEFDVLGGDRIKVKLHTGMKPYSEEAVVAEERFDIRPMPVQTRAQGRTTTEEIILGASFSSGLERVTVPFFEYGMPVEYELIRSINTVAQKERKTVAILGTGATIGYQMVSDDGTSRREGESFLSELKKQYDVEVLDPESPITVWETGEDGEGEESLRYDVLVVPQPSMLSAQGMSNLISALKAGQPTAIFEDPLCVTQMAMSTSQARNQSQLTGDIKQLWELLQIEVFGQIDRRTNFQPDIVWQAYNPYPQISEFQQNPEVVFIRPELKGNEEPFNEESEITKGLEELMLPYPGAMRPTEVAEELGIFAPLLETGEAGVIRFDKLVSATPQDPNEPRRSIESLRGNPIGRYILAAQVKGEIPASAIARRPGEQATDDKPIDLNVVYVADLDLLHWQWVSLRNQPNAGEVTFRIQNLTFGLNVIDVLADDLDYVNIRKRSRTFKTLKAMEEQIDVARDAVFEERQQFEKDFDDAVQKARQEKEEAVKPYRDITEDMERQILAGQSIDRQAYNARKLLEQSVTEKQDEKLKTRIKQLERERDEKLRQIERRTDLAIVKKQNEIKFNALWIPVVPPLVLSLVVFTMRRLRERAGIAKSRLR